MSEFVNKLSRHKRYYLLIPYSIFLIEENVSSIIDKFKVYSVGYKYPTLEEYIAEGLYLATRFPFLDMIFAITQWDSCPPEEWQKFLTDHSYDYFEEKNRGIL